MARKRSWRELQDIKAAIRERAENQGYSDLSLKALAQARKYSENIAKTKSARNYVEKWKAGDADTKAAIEKVAYGRKYSPNTYKGINAG